MPNIPTPIRAALGLAATAVDEVRKLPETLPQAVTTVPLMAVSSAMQASLKVQQHIAMLAARGDEVLSQLRGSSSEPPSWATFDDSPTGGPDDDAQPAKAAFDRIDYDTGFAEGADDDSPGRWDAVGVGGTQPEAEAPDAALDTGLPPLELDLADDVTATPPSEAGPTPPPSGLAEAVSQLDLPASADAESGPATTTSARGGARKAAAAGTAPGNAGPGNAGPGKAGPGKAAAAKTGPAKAKSSPAKAAKVEPANAGPVKAGPAKAAKARSAKAGPAEAGPAKAAKAGPDKAAPAKAAKRAGRKAPDHEPLEEAARKAKPSATPNPATMAAEILQAQEAAAEGE